MGALVDELIKMWRRIIITDLMKKEQTITIL